jgi:hypothetical protein
VIRVPPSLYPVLAERARVSQVKADARTSWMYHGTRDFPCRIYHDLTECLSAQGRVPAAVGCIRRSREDRRVMIAEESHADVAV